MNKYEANSELYHNLNKQNQNQIEFNNNDVKQIFVNKYLAKYINIMEVKAQKYKSIREYTESQCGSLNKSVGEVQIKESNISYGATYKFMGK